MKVYLNKIDRIVREKCLVLRVQISSVRSKMHLFQNKMNEQIS